MKRIAIHGVPRSGTTWLGSIIDSSPNVRYCNQPLFAYSLKGFLSENSSQKEIIEFYDKLNDTQDEYILQTEARKEGIIPTFSKGVQTHIAYKEARYHNILRNLIKQCPDIKVIGIIRNPKAVLASWYNAPREFDKKNWSFEDEWEHAPSKNMGKAEEFYGYSKWKEIAQLFLKLQKDQPDNLKIIRYIDLIQNPIYTTQEIFKFCDLKFQPQTMKFLSESNSTDLSNEAYSVYRIKKDDTSWKKVIPENIAKAIDHDLEYNELAFYNI